MNLCPCCFVDLSVARAWMCTSERCPVPDGAPEGTLGPVVPGPAPVTGQGRPEPVPPPACRDCGVVMAEVCPNGSCRLMLPEDWRDTPATTVALAGARATGKSIYIAVLVKQLERFGELNGVRVSPATMRTRDHFRAQYEEPLFVERGLLPPTGTAETANAPQRVPLVFALSPRQGGRHYLVLRDVAGDDMQNAERLRAETLSFFVHADAVVFLFDPLGITSIRELLMGLIPAQQSVGGDPVPVLGTVLRLMRGSGRSQRLAVVMSKFDALHAMRAVDGGFLSRIMQHTGAAFSREPGWYGPYNDEDGKLLHEEVRSLLHVLNCAGIVTDVERAAVEQGVEHRFFAASALGDAPAGTQLHDRGIAPFRCLDPVRWALPASVL